MIPITQSVESFKSWLDSHLKIFIQGVPPARDLSAILGEANRVLAIPRRDGKSGAEDIDGLWLRAIADQDFTSLKKHAGGEQPSDGVFELAGEFVASVSVTRAIEVIGRSRALREHYFKLLETEHLRRDSRWTNNFRENLWFALRAARLSPSEVRRAKELIELEPDDEIRGVAKSVLAQHLSPSERDVAQIELIQSAWGRVEPEEVANVAVLRQDAGCGTSKAPSPAKARGFMLLVALVMAVVAVGGLYWAFSIWVGPS
jgi:hypothetical protein